MFNRLTDVQIAGELGDLARAVQLIGDNLTERAFDESRCQCNAWGRPGLCGVHSDVYHRIREAAVALQAVSSYLVRHATIEGKKGRGE